MQDFSNYRGYHLKKIEIDSIQLMTMIGDRTYAEVKCLETYCNYNTVPTASYLWAALVQRAE
jgi:hypothetical protein